MLEITKDKLFYNAPQLAVKLSSVPHKMLVMGRGVGKTTIFGDELLKFVFAMPRCKLAFGGLTYYHVRTKSMPVIIDQWERRGLLRDMHYFIGHKAPKKYGWREPYQPPLDYSHCVHFYDGSVIEFISFDRPEVARSGSYDGMFFDEAAKLKKSALDSDVLPANRGNSKGRFENIRYHHGTLFATTMPLTATGEWVFEYEALAQEHPQDYFYLEASARENIAILGEKYFRDQKRVLPQIIYDTEIENLRPNFNKNTFYPKLSERNLYYNAINYNFYDAKGYEVRSDKVQCRGDADIRTGQPLDLSIDFGTRINCAVVGQEQLPYYRILKNFYLEHDTIENVIKQFIAYYEPHRATCNTLRLWGGSDGVKRRNANSLKSYFDEIVEQLTQAGWSVELMAKMVEIPHLDKYMFYNRALDEQQTNIPLLMINQNNAFETYTSMKDAPMLVGEIAKDKRSERNEALAQWKATHLSDAVDNLYYWRYYHLQDSYAGPSYDIIIR